MNIHTVTNFQTNFFVQSRQHHWFHRSIVLNQVLKFLNTPKQTKLFEIFIHFQCQKSYLFEFF